ncbi:MAG: hypothetical protein IPN94_23025 [Sphingobacteriales bacterium]|nr:hypothetical protein [Sphingobacteriales bacterium]
MGENEDYLDADFGFTPIPTGSMATLYGTTPTVTVYKTWYETGIPGVTITLYDSNGDVIATTKPTIMATTYLITYLLATIQ